MPTDTNANRGNLTQAKAASLRPADREYIYWDDRLRGFGLRVAPSGQKSFLVQFRVRGARGEKWVERQKSIGRLSFMTVDQARIAANKLKSDAAQGIDPVQTARIKHASDKAEQIAQSFTFDRLLERYSEYIDRQVGAWTLRQSSAAETKRLLRRWQAVLADRPVKDINKADVLGFLNERTAQGTGLVELQQPPDHDQEDFQVRGRARSGHDQSGGRGCQTAARQCQP